MPRPTRESLAVDRITDVYGTEWLVSEFRPSGQGFALPLGWPVEGVGPGNPRVITTAALAEYLQSVERPRDIVLPIGASTIKRLRAELDLHFEWNAWWAARADDLHTMTLEQFCRRHGCSMGAASQRRRATPRA
ncbi:hypothetical protein [Sphingomonas pituitosa]|uniref:hypothetical protein n=1 Tax=Sphingomonas pituitosa TaxID=99597 RepID=UPI000831891F|nr:hypothetical protein [Sphingomonas pituitosa]